MPAEVDHRSIPDNAGLLRRIAPDQVVQDSNGGGHRPSSAAFKDTEMSVDVEPLLAASGLDWRFTLKGHPGFSLVRLPARAAREKSLAVVPRPVAGNPAHAEVIGKKTQSIANHLRSSSTWVYLDAASKSPTADTA